MLVREGTGVGLRRRALSVEPAHQPGWDLVTLRAAYLERLIDEATGFGADVLILDPPEARKAVIDRLRAVAS